eukprot:jgi/Bigna1/138600/aug1.45_g13308
MNDKATVELLIQLTDEMRHLLGLQLFNIDAVVEEETGRIFVVDVNYFPGYQKCIRDLGPRFLRFLDRVAQDAGRG